MGRVLQKAHDQMLLCPVVPQRVFIQPPESPGWTEPAHSLLQRPLAISQRLPASLAAAQHRPQDREDPEHFHTKAIPAAHSIFHENTCRAWHPSRRTFFLRPTSVGERCRGAACVPSSGGCVDARDSHPWSLEPGLLPSGWSTFPALQPRKVPQQPEQGSATPRSSFI